MSHDGYRRQIESTAEDYGWQQDRRFTGYQLVLRRDDHYVDLTFGSNGTLRSATTDRRDFDSNKVDNVLRYLIRGGR